MDRICINFLFEIANNVYENLNEALQVCRFLPKTLAHVQHVQDAKMLIKQEIRKHTISADCLWLQHFFFQSDFPTSSLFKECFSISPLAAFDFDKTAEKEQCRIKKKNKAKM